MVLNTKGFAIEFWKNGRNYVRFSYKTLELERLNKNRYIQHITTIVYCCCCLQHQIYIFIWKTKRLHTKYTNTYLHWIWIHRKGIDTNTQFSSNTQAFTIRKHSKQAQAKVQAIAESTTRIKKNIVCGKKTLWLAAPPSSEMANRRTKPFWLGEISFMNRCCPPCRCTGR